MLDKANPLPLRFSQQDPVPLLADFPSYREAQLHSRQVDEWLGFQVDETELAIARDITLTPFEQREQWVGLNPDALQTPYTECRSVLNIVNLQPGQNVVDLGAAYARMGVVVGMYYPESFYNGYEISEPRVTQAWSVLNRLNFKNVTLLQQDLARPDFVPFPADVYFIYDFGSPESIRIVLSKLKAIAAHRTREGRGMQVVARGRGCRDRIEKFEPWLSEVGTPRIFPHFTVFSTT
jgi:hypothetical protein